MAVIYATELFSESLSQELMPLLREHWLEVARFKDIPLEPDFDLYATAQAQGILRIFTAREEGRLSGYAVFFVRPNPHYKSSLQAVQDVLFVTPHMRKGFAGARFIKYCDDALRKSGVQIVYHHVKNVRDFGSVLARMGYEPVDVIYAKRLDTWEGV